MAESNKKKSLILMVEDEKDLVEIYGWQISQVGMDLHVSQDGQQALDYLKNNTPQFVLLDLLMPQVDGFAFLDAIKKYPNRKKMLIYAWSNLTQQKHIDLAKQKGVDGFLIKSDYTPKKLAEKIMEILKK